MSRRLTRRQREVVALVAGGLNGREIAARLYISPATVKGHIKNALKGLGAVNRAHAVALAAMSGELILPLPDRHHVQETQ
jgi:DNA-binding CsgD family transcriptional regulator